MYLHTFTYLLTYLFNIYLCKYLLPTFEHTNQWPKLYFCLNGQPEIRTWTDSNKYHVLAKLKTHDYFRHIYLIRSNTYIQKLCLRKKFISLHLMAISVMEFQVCGYKVRKINIPKGKDWKWELVKWRAVKNWASF